MGKSKENRTNFLVQGSILAVASIISRIIGLVYRIPMNSILGDIGNGYYSCAFDIYNVILIISSYSLPLAVSKTVSAKVAKGQFNTAYQVLKGALTFALVVGSIAALVVYLVNSEFCIFFYKSFHINRPSFVCFSVLCIFTGLEPSAAALQKAPRGLTV